MTTKTAHDFLTMLAGDSRLIADLRKSLANSLESGATLTQVVQFAAAHGWTFDEEHLRSAHLVSWRMRRQRYVANVDVHSASVDKSPRADDLGQ